MQSNVVTLSDGGGGLKDVNWGVVNNGLDFLESSVQYLARSDNRSLKYAALHLFASMETLVKARLAREHWTLVVADSNVPTKAAFESGNFRSISLGQALQRLGSVADITVDGKDVERIKDVEKLRNRAAHFSLAGETPERVKVVVARGIDFTLRFIEKWLRPEAPIGEARLIDETLERVREAIGRIQVLVEERMKSLEAELASHLFVLDCPACRQGSLVLSSDQAARCLYCLYCPGGEVCAEEYSASILEISRYGHALEGVDWPIHSCLNCGVEAFVNHIYTAGQEEVGWACFACGYYVSTAEIEICFGCGSPMDVRGGGTSLCGDCAAAKFEKF
ncbi:hypothetical protein ACFYUR_09390 [Micromonospora haikouensis]|uniref:hypothetical protein n=1 Tax=Micromonospora haikouensis TaxID=686309 RepID=UPI0036A5B90A